VEIAVLRQQLAELRAAAGNHPAIAATLLARSKAAAARGETSGLATAPRRLANPVAWEPGSDAGPAGRGPADNRSASMGPADNGSAGAGAADAGSPANSSAGSASAGSASPGSAPAGAVSEEAAASRDD
jgi:hypothetical protein